jgi:hypothetical protein
MVLRLLGNACKAIFCDIRTDVNDTSVKIITQVTMFFFVVVTPCGLVGRHSVSEKHTASIFRAEGIVSSSGLPMSAHGITTQKKNVAIFTAVRTSHISQVLLCGGRSAYVKVDIA